MESDLRAKLGNKIALNTMIVNIALSILKFSGGIIGKSSAMIADAVHSLSDIISTVAVMIGLHMAKKPADEDHHYGHEKIEPIVAKILASILFVTAIGIGYDGFQKLRVNSYQTPKMIVVYAAVISIIVKEWMYRYTIRGAKKINSPALAADAWHHRSDAFSSIGTLVAIVGARYGYPFLDPLASILISVFIIKVAIDIYKDSVKQLIDFAGDKEMRDEIKNVILNVEGVIKINNFKIRQHANMFYVDVAVLVDGDLTVTEGHQIALNVHKEVEEKFKNVKHCMVHVDPYEVDSSD